MIKQRTKSDGSSADYYVIPSVSTFEQLLQVIDPKVRTLFEVCYIYGDSVPDHSLPDSLSQLQDLISYKNMNAQMGEVFRAVKRYGCSEHSDEMRDARKIKYYIEAELSRIGMYEAGDTRFNQKVFRLKAMLSSVVRLIGKNG